MSDEVRSPCVKKCSLNNANLCTGCGRKLHEIISWESADNETRARIVREAALRKDELKKREGTPR